MFDREKPARSFKTVWFAKAAHKARIKDVELCEAIHEAMKGQADDSGEGVFKKRLSKDGYRRIIITKIDKYWIYEYLFAKKNRANITKNELEDFRILAKTYAKLNETKIDRLLRDAELMEICHAKK